MSSLADFAKTRAVELGADFVGIASPNRFDGAPPHADPARILPDYRGRMATCWSIYHQDPTSGYTFHRISAKMDAGNTLIQGLVPVKTHFRVQDIEHEKAVRAAKNMPSLFEIIMRREIGQFQEGTGKYISKKDKNTRNAFLIGL